jgi:hypothetical protein
VSARFLQISLLVLVLAATAAGAADGLARGDTTQAVPQSLVGCWSRHVPALPIGSAAGVWLIRIKSSGAFAAYTPGTTTCDAKWDFTSHVSVSSGRLTIGHVPICASNGVYAVKPARRSFALRAVSDRSCASRLGLLAGTWKRQS